MVNTTLIFSLLLSISALTTSFAAWAENSDCPPGTNANSLCQQFKVRGVVTAKTFITGPESLILEKVEKRIEGETSKFTVKTNVKTEYIEVAFARFPNPQGLMGLKSDTTDCSISSTEKNGFNVHIKILKNDDKAYVDFTNNVQVPFIPGDGNTGNTASFKLKFTSVAEFGSGLEVLDGGSYSCKAELMLAVPS